MEAQLAEFRNKGMMQDASISKSSNEFAFKNVNIRITAVNDNTLFSVTNEKGTSNVDIVRSIINNQVSFYEDGQQPGDWWAQCQYPAKTQLFVIFESPDSPQGGYQWDIDSGETESYGAHHIDEVGNPDTDYQYVYFYDSEDKILVDDKYQYYIKGIQEPEPYTSTQILGTYIGKCILGDYLIIFTKESGHDRIYRCKILDNGKLLADCIVDRNLGFDGPVETVGYFEREDIQKVYWVDGENPNRVINIMLDADEQPNSFDFNPELGDLPVISVEKKYDGIGSFLPGTIQYFISYYNKLGQESRVANSTPLYYITKEDVGGEPGDTLSCSFTLNISRLNTNFQYARIYSAIRTTLDGPIDARIVGDFTIPASGTISITDTGRNQEAIDPTILYYIGGDVFCASTIEDKDNTLFFGNIKVDSVILTKDEVSSIQNAFLGAVKFRYYDTGIEIDSPTQFHLERNSAQSKHFKYGNIYEFAIQFIDSMGQMTDAIHVATLQCQMPPICTGRRGTGDVQKSHIYIPKVTMLWSDVNTNSILEILSRFESYRILMAETSAATRVVLAQGIVMPTVFKLGNRIDEDGPYAIPSWFARFQNTPNSRHFEVIGGHRFADEPEGGPSRVIERYDGSRSAEISSQRSIVSPLRNLSYYKNSFYVDESILTMNSPDISYSDKYVLDGIKFRIVGFTRNVGRYNDYLLTIENKRNNVVETVPLTYKSVDMDAHAREWYIPSGSSQLSKLYSWNDYAEGADLPLNVSGTEQSPTGDYYEVISAWHNSGALGWISGKNTIKNKLYSTYKHCARTAYFSAYDTYDYPDISYGSEELFKLGNKYISGNYDELIPPQSTYHPFIPSIHDKNWWWDDNPNFSDSTERTGVNHTESVRIKVKFGDFITINLGSQTILPYISNISQQWNLNKIYSTGTSGTPAWGGTDVSLIGQHAISPNVYIVNSDSTASTATILDGHEDLAQGPFSYTPKEAGTSLSSVTIDYNTRFLFLAELYRNVSGSTLQQKADSLYGNVESIKWIQCGPIHKIMDENTAPEETEGDTFFQRYECLRAYPYTENDINSVVDIVSFMVETYKNLDTRYDTNRGYEKINYARPTNFCLLNPAYDHIDNVLKYNTIENTLQYSRFPQQFAWSLNKSAVSEVDAWTSATLSNIYNADGSYGPINAIEKLNDTLVAFQDRAIFVINFNNRTQISTEQGLPIELANSGKVDGITYLTRHYGCKNKYSIASTKTGIYFIDDENRAFVNISKDGIADITASSGMSVWFEKQTSYNKKWGGGNIAAASNHNAFVVGYDSNRGDIYIMNGANSDAGCLVYNETLKTFTSFFDVSTTGYRFPLMYNFNGETYGFDGADNSFNKLFGGTYNSNYSVEYRVNPEPLVGKIFTNIDYIADVYDTQKGVDDAVSLANISTSTLQPFDEISVFNEYQQKINVPLTENKWLQPTNATMFRIRHAEIPSTGTYGIDRMHNPWIHLKLKGNAKSALMQFHSLTVKYFK